MKKAKLLTATLCETMIMSSLIACGVTTPTPPATQKETSNDASINTEEDIPSQKNTIDTSKATYKMNIGSAVSSTNPSTIALQSFKNEVETKTNGDIAVEIFPDSALGSETDLVEQVRNGDTEACMQMGAANFSSIVPECNFSLLPFLFSSLDSARAAWDGELGTEYAEKLINPQGYKVLSIWESGYRHMTNNTRPIKEPADIKGIKFRTNENDMKLAMFNALDASVVIMPFSDVYTGLQNGTIDGQENPLANIYTSSLQDVQKYLSMTGHMYDAAPLVCNAEWFNNLPADYQQILIDSAANAKKIDLEKNDETTYLNLLKETAIQINDDVDTKAFQKAMEPVWQDFANKYPDGQYWIDLATSFNK